MLLAIHAAATWFMAGMIWTIQTVHYPLFPHVGRDAFVGYETEHTVRMGRLLALPAVIEVASATALVFSADVAVPVAVSSGAVLAAIWVVTLLVQVPLHTRLTVSPDPAVVDRLVRTNWFRTVAWTVRAIVALALLV